MVNDGEPPQVGADKAVQSRLPSCLSQMINALLLLPSSVIPVFLNFLKRNLLKLEIPIAQTRTVSYGSSALIYEG
jgi:hypothetical protein